MQMLSADNKKSPLANENVNFTKETGDKNSYDNKQFNVIL